MAYARRKFFDLHTNNRSQIAQEALVHIQRLYLGNPPIFSSGQK